MRVAILGASGFLGRHLTAALRARGDDVRPSSLRDPVAAAHVADGCDAVVNLSGEPVAQRWSGETKRRIRESRTVLPRAFLHALRAMPERPTVYVSASAIGYYGTSESATFTETSPPGTDFLARVCVEWEQVANGARDLGMRVSCVRSGIVLGSDGGALAKMLPIFRSGAGGRVGSGKQWFSWIHVADAVAMYMLALGGAEGAIDATAPKPVTNDEFTTALGKALGRATPLAVPSFALKMLLGDGAAALLEGQRVLPERALALGYTFKFPTVDTALADLLG